VKTLWEACDLVDEHIGDEPIMPLSPRIAVRAAEHDLPAGLVAALDLHLRAQSAGDRLLEVLQEVGRVRAEAGWPPLATPIGQILASQALVNVLSARRYGTFVDEFRGLVRGSYGSPPAPIDPAISRAVSLLADGARLEDDPPTAEDVRAEAEGLAASEEELVLLAMFGDEAETLLETIRARHTREGTLLGSEVDASRAERIRELVRIVQESGVAEVEIEDAGMRVSVRRHDELASIAQTAAGLPELEDAPVVVAERAGLVRVESPMVGNFYRAPQPGAPPYTDVGETVSAGQTLCILEAMKLMNEVKSEVDAVVRAVHVDNGQSVEFGQLLFELEPVSAPPAV
jgi:oxaloacetate decarboxylase alpha subunit